MSAHVAFVKLSKGKKMIVSSKRSVTVVAGLSGYGKNTFVLRYLVNADLSARFIFDPDPGEFNSDQGEFADRLKLDPTQSAYDLAKHLVQGWVVFDPHVIFQGSPQSALNFYCEWAYEKSLQLPGEKALVVDEIWKYCSANYIPDGIRSVALSGRKPKLQLFALTQEPNKLNSTFQGAMSEFVCFRLQGDKQLGFAADFGFNREEIANLDPLQYVARNLDTGGELRGTIKI